MNTRNQILLNKLKNKYPNLNIDKPIYDDNYWDNISNSLKSEEKVLNFNETNNITKEISK